MLKVLVMCCVLSSLCSGYIRINNIVSDAIDSADASQYRLFSDIHGFVSAYFYEYGDSVMIEVNTAVDGQHETKYYHIDRKIVDAINDYILNFRTLIENQQYRYEFVRTHKIAWPLVAQAEIDELLQEHSAQKENYTLWCMSGTTGISAYIGAIVGTKKESGCLNYYSINTNTLLGSACAGAGSGLLASQLYHPGALSDVLKHDVVAFDDSGLIITESDIANETGANYLQNGSTIIAGCGISLATGYLLQLPWGDYAPKTDAEFIKTALPIITISIFEILSIHKWITRNTKAANRQAAIERIKKKRMEEKHPATKEQ